MRWSFSKHFVVFAMVAAVCWIWSSTTEASAESITYNFTGTVSSPSAVFPVSLPFGTVISGSYTFDSTAAALGGSTSITSVFNALTAFSFTGNGFTDSSSAAAEIQVGNKDGVAELTDRYAVVSRVNDGLAGSFGLSPGGAFILRLDQNAGTLFSSALSLPTSISLADFDSSSFFIFDGKGNAVSGTLTSFGRSSVPEPVSLLLLGPGLLGLGLVRRRNRVSL